MQIVQDVTSSGQPVFVSDVSQDDDVGELSSGQKFV